MTNDPRPLPDDKKIQKVARLLEESSLGTVGARQLRDRAINDRTARIRCRAHFAASESDEQWWLANQHNREALIQKSEELTANGLHEIGALLKRLACQAAVQEEAPASSDSPVAGIEFRIAMVGPPAEGKTFAAYWLNSCASNWRSFGTFYRDNVNLFIRILGERITLPEDIAKALIRQAMIKAFDNWENIAAMGDPGEWVIGYALQLYRKSELPDEDDSWAYEDGHQPAGTSGTVPSSPSTQCADVRVTGALARVTELTPPDECSRYRLSSVNDIDNAPCAAIPVTALWKTGPDRDDFTELFRAYCTPLTRMAALLVGDVSWAEEVVQDSFIALYERWLQPDFRDERESDRALRYLRRNVVNRSRSVLRSRAVAYRPFLLDPGESGNPSAEEEAVNSLEQSAVLSAVLALPTRQREALVLRYYCDLPEATIAEIMGISSGAVKSHTARAMTALRNVLSEQNTDQENSPLQQAASGDSQENTAGEALAPIQDAAAEISGRHPCDHGSERLPSAADVATSPQRGILARALRQRASSAHRVQAEELAPSEVAAGEDWLVSPAAVRPAVPGRPTLHQGTRPELMTGQNCTVIVTDVVGFSSPGRDDFGRLILRQTLAAMTYAALQDIPGEFHGEDRGDGVLIVVPPSVTTGKVLEYLHDTLPKALKRHNNMYSPSAQIQLRIAVDVGPVISDDTGVSGQVIINAARLLDAPALKKAIGDSGTQLGVIVSDFVYQTTVRQAPHVTDPQAWTKVRVRSKEASSDAWMASGRPSSGVCSGSA